jgi:hypothetical protein
MANMPELLVVFGSRATLLAQDEHLRHGGLFLPCPQAPLPEVGATLRLRLRANEGAGAIEAALHATVMQVFGQKSMAVTVADASAAREALAPVFAAASGEPAVKTAEQPDMARWAEPGALAVVGTDEAPHAAAESADTDDADAEGDAQPDGEGGTLFDQIRALPVRERMQLARHAGQAERLVLAKDTNKTVHTFLVQNPRITLDEIRALAGNRQTGPDALKLIAENRTWLASQGIVLALVHNPKTPTPTAVKLLDRLPLPELQRLVRQRNAPPGVVEAARKKTANAR